MNPEKLNITENGNYRVIKRERRERIGVHMPETAPKKIFLTAHPDDAAALEETARELVGLFPYEVWTPKDPAAHIDDLGSVLSEMMLVVILVSKAFLHTENPARCEVFPEAVGMEKRVLTIRLEADIERDFDAICGPYHLMQRAGGDFTERLRRYLDGVADPGYMIEEEKTAAIREGLFTFRIFISYRKKDLDYLLRILDALHACPQLYDASIWYDDGLIAGEDYNAQIAEKLAEADLVLFAVTDHFTEEGNYVLIDEYPRAVRNQKAILPVLAEGTGEAQIARRYPAFGRMIPCTETDRWLGEIVSVREALGKGRGPLTPQELFMAALEYRDGTRTAQSTAMEYKLYHLAAEGGDPAAMYRLGTAYLYGDHVEKDADKGSKMLMHSVGAFLEELRDSSVPKETKMAHRFALREMTPQLYTYYRQKGMIADAENILAIEDELAEEKESGLADSEGYPLHFDMAIYYFNQGEYQQAIRHFDAAEKAFFRTTFFRDTELLMIYAYRGEAYAALVRAGDHRFLSALIRNNTSFLDLSLRLMREEQYTRDDFERIIPDFSPILYGCVGDLIHAATLRENDQNGMSEAQEAYRYLCENMPHFIRLSPAPELWGSYALAMYSLAVAGREVPDVALLTEAYEIYHQLAEGYPQAAQFKQYTNTVYKEIIKAKAALDAHTEWIPVNLVPQEAHALFSPSDGTAGYRCPHCGERMAQTDLSRITGAALYVRGGLGAYIEPSTIFASSCGRFYAAPKGYRLTDGFFLYAEVVRDPSNPDERELFRSWRSWFDFVSKLV